MDFIILKIIKNDKFRYLCDATHWLIIFNIMYMQIYSIVNNNEQLYIIFKSTISTLNIVFTDFISFLICIFIIIIIFVVSILFHATLHFASINFSSNLNKF